MKFNGKGPLGVPRYSSIGPLSEPVENEQVPFESFRVARRTRDELVQVTGISTVNIEQAFLGNMTEENMFAAVYRTIPGEVPERMIQMMGELVYGSYIRGKEEIINHVLLHEFGHHITSEIIYFDAGKEPLQNLVNEGYLDLKDINHPDELRVDSIDDLFNDIKNQNVPDIFDESAKSMSGTQNGDVLGHELGEAIAKKYVGKERDELDLSASIERGIEYNERRFD